MNPNQSTATTSRSRHQDASEALTSQSPSQPPNKPSSSPPDIHILDHEINDLEYSTFYSDVCCVGTMSYGHWFHTGDLYLIGPSPPPSSSNHSRATTTILSKLKNRTGVHALTWSEHYTQTVMCGNHDGSVSFWQVNHGKQLVSVQCDKGYAISDVDWNQLDHDWILTSSHSSRVKLFDINHLEFAASSYTEHTKSVNGIRWNTNNRDEFATVSDDGLLKVWDRRTSDYSSVNTMLDRTDPAALTCLDWHKRDDWLIGVGDRKGQVLLWDTRNSLQPLQRRYAHGSNKANQKSANHTVNDLRFDSNDCNRFATCSEDHSLRIWSMSDDAQKQGIYLTNEHKFHRRAGRAVDWNIHNADSITSGGADHSLIDCSLSQMVKVTEYEKDGQLIVCTDFVLLVFMDIKC